MRHTPSASFGAILAAALLALLSFSPLQAQDQTVGLFTYDSAAAPGYTFFAPMGSGHTYLIDMWGRYVHSWSTTLRPGLSAYLLEDGDLLRTGSTGIGAGAGGKIQRFTWNGTLVWDFNYNTADYLQHHDFEPLPNGNVLILAWENKTPAEAYGAGRDPARLISGILSPEHIVEVEPTGLNTGNIVWEWHLWDHLIQDFEPTMANYGVVAEHPELIDINFGNTGQDWIHANSIDYNAELDQIIISARSFDEFWIIDHSTTTAEAAGHTGGNQGMGGDILYRWGNPQAYGAGTAADERLYNQHDARWIPSGYPGAGNVMVFNNGGGRPGGDHSSVDEIITTVDGSGNYPQPAPGVPHAPADPVWAYKATPPTSWFNGGLCGATRMLNGNTLICSGQDGEIFEVTTDSQVVWRYKNPAQGDGFVDQGETRPADLIFRCARYAADYPGLAGRDLTPTSALEIYPITISGARHTPDLPTPRDSVIVTATITGNNPITTAAVYADYGSGFTAWTMHDDGNHHDGAASDGLYGAALPPVTGEITIPYYVHAEDEQGSSVDDPPNPPSTVYWFSVCCTLPKIFINEFMAVNTACCQDEHGDFDAWIELYNFESFDVDVSGMYLTNDLDDSARFLIGDTIIPAGGYLLFWADNEMGEGLTHTNFILNSLEGAIGLYSADDLNRILIDSVSYTAQPADESYGRVADGAPGWTEFITPTPDAENSDCACLNQGDAEPDGFVTALDLASCIDILFTGATDLQDPGCPSPRFDIDCDDFSTALDLAVLIDHLFSGGGEPCDPCSP